MKKIIYFAILVLLLSTWISCNDDFLSKNEVDLYALNDTLKLNNTQTNLTVPIQLPVLDDRNYTIIMQPKWLSFSSMHGMIKNGILLLDMDILNDITIAGFQTHYATIMIDIEDLGVVGFTVSYENYGSPSLQCSPSSLNFESISTDTIYITNTSEGILNWEITGIPDWLVITPSHGSLLKNNSTMVLVELKQDLLNLDQENSESFRIISNSITADLVIPVHVEAIVIESPETQYISGIVTDAEYNQQAGIMAIVAKSPDKLYVFNTNTNKTDTLPLPGAPNCISISEDGRNAVIGYSVPLVSYIDTETPEIIKNFNIEDIPFDIALGDNGWCYLTPSTGEWEDLRNLNLGSGEILKTSDSFNFCEKSLIRKIYGKPYLIGARTQWSPSGLYLFDLTNGKASDIITYYHISIDKFWISKDGSKIFTAYGNIFKIHVFDGQMHVENPDQQGQIVYSVITALDECPDCNSIFFTSNIFDNSPEFKPIIEQYDLSTLTRIRTFRASPVYLTENGNRVLYYTSPRFIFVKKDGSSLYILKNLREYYNKNFWAIEVFHPGS